jgi:hypothetical protein
MIHERGEIYLQYQWLQLEFDIVLMVSQLCSADHIGSPDYGGIDTLRKQRKWYTGKSEYEKYWVEHDPRDVDD